MTLRSGLAVLVLPALAVAPSAQQPPSQRPPVFRTGVNVVTIDVTAVDKDGRPIKGLKADDFVVTLEGQPRPVQTLDYVEFGSGTGAAGGPAAAKSTASSRRERRVVVMLFDDLSVKPGASAETFRSFAEVHQGDYFHTMKNFSAVMHAPATVP